MDTFSHFGICVSDLDRSLRFYCDGLGFEMKRKWIDDGKLKLFYTGGFYIDRMRRTPDGWRIVDRYEDMTWSEGLDR